MDCRLTAAQTLSLASASMSVYITVSELHWVTERAEHGSFCLRSTTRAPTTDRLPAAALTRYAPHQPRQRLFCRRALATSGWAAGTALGAGHCPQRADAPRAGQLPARAGARHLHLRRHGRRPLPGREPGLLRHPHLRRLHGLRPLRPAPRFKFHAASPPPCCLGELGGVGCGQSRSSPGGGGA